MATDLLGELRALPTSSRPLGDPPEHDELPSSPDPELELLLLLLVYIREESWDPLGEGGNEEPKQGCERDCRLLLEFSLYMDTGLVRLGEPPHDPMYDITPPVLFVSTAVVMLSPSKVMQVYDRISNATPRDKTHSLQMHFCFSCRSVLLYDKVITATK